MASKSKNEQEVNEVETVIVNDEELSETPSGFRVIVREIKKDKLALISFFVVVALILIPYIWSIFLNPQDVTNVNIMDRYALPGENGHLLGADEGGRDIFEMLILGARNSLTIAISVTVLAEGIGIIVGLISGYFGGIVDNILMRIVDFIMIMPQFLIMIVLVTIVPKYSAWTLVWIITAFGWVGTARYTRSLVLSESRREYIMASKTSGTSNLMIIFREMLPNVSSVIIVGLTLSLAGNIGLEAGLSFLGYGLPPDTPSIGTLVGYANDPEIITSYPWIWLPAALFLLLITLGINFIGQALRRAADARQRLG